MSGQDEPRRDQRSPIREFGAGAAAMAPILVGIVPLGLIGGVATVEAGLGIAEAMGFSALAFAGAAQLAALDLMARDTSLPVVVMTALVINVRVVMYSASIAPHLAHLPRRRRLAASYMLVDQVYAISIVRFTRDAEIDRWRFFVGAAVPMLMVWVSTTGLGVLVGDAVPDAVPLAFALPLAFIALLVPTVTDRPGVVAALTAAVVATVAAPLPANLGMPLAATAGILAGWIAAARRETV